MKFKILFQSLIGLTLVLPVTAAMATNGLFSEGWGAISGGMAGSGNANPQDSMVSATNPAGLVALDDRSDFGIMLFAPTRGYTVSGAFSPSFPPFPGPEVESGSGGFVIPNFGMKREIDSDSAWGFSIYGNGGMNTDYAASDTVVPTPAGPMAIGTFGGGTAGVDYAHLFLNTSYSKKVSSNVALGIAGILNYSTFEMKGISGFDPFSVSPGNVSDNGKDSDTGFGAVLSAHFGVDSNTSMALSYQTEVDNTFDKYSGLFANGGELTIPARANIALAFKSNSGSALHLDVEKIFYEDADAIGNSPAGLLACMGGDVSQCLGGTNGAGFGWEDMTVYKLGFQFKSGNDMTWRFGVSTTDGPIDSEDVTLNILATGTPEKHYAAGFTNKLDNGREFSMSLMYVPEACVEGPSQFVPDQTVEICMEQMALRGQYSW
ncbi:MAG: long-chain fatty acid transport protein [Gammaproteobacteria bacterium]|jgi:long-chain fatty acid transport protein